jgi:hypothetical protein
VLASTLREMPRTCWISSELRPLDSRNETLRSVGASRIDSSSRNLDAWSQVLGISRNVEASTSAPAEDKTQEETPSTSPTQYSELRPLDSRNETLRSVGASRIDSSSRNLDAWSRRACRDLTTHPNHHLFPPGRGPIRRPRSRHRRPPTMRPQLQPPPHSPEI